MNITLGVANAGVHRLVDTGLGQFGLLCGATPVIESWSTTTAELTCTQCRSLTHAQEFVRYVLTDIFNQNPTREQIRKCAAEVIEAVGGPKGGDLTQRYYNIIDGPGRTTIHLSAGRAGAAGRTPRSTGQITVCGWVTDGEWHLGRLYEVEEFERIVRHCEACAKAAKA